MLAPIALFVYNRPNHTYETLQALSQNTLANQSILYIFSDGIKKSDNANEIAKIKEVRQIIKSQKWCKEVIIIEADNNKGLAKSIIEGVSRLITEYGKVIVLEDDIKTSIGFLSFMNDALTHYESVPEVMHISGYFYPSNERLDDTFFYNIPLCWGWGTWKRAWDHFINDVQFLYNEINKRNLWKEFNKFGNNELKNQLLGNMSGKIETWFIKWHCSILLKNGYSLHPGNSLVNNLGFDNSGVHGNFTFRYWHLKLADFVKVLPIPLKESEKAEQICKEFFYSGSKKRKKSFSKEPLPIKARLKNLLRSFGRSVLIKILPELSIFRQKLDWRYVKSESNNSAISNKALIYTPYNISKALIDDYTYIANNSNISIAKIGKFCSIGPNFICGWGIHPLNGVSTAPMFYSTKAQNGFTLVKENKFTERKQISIRNDVFIGANVTVLDGVTIGDGAVIGAGAVVVSDIPPYAIAVGVPARVVKYRFTEDKIEKLLAIKWWHFNEDKLKLVEKNFWDIESFIQSVK